MLTNVESAIAQLQNSAIPHLDGILRDYTRNDQRAIRAGVAGVQNAVANAIKLLRDDATIAALPIAVDALKRIDSINGSTGGPAALVSEFKFIAANALAAVEAAKAPA